MFSLRKIIPQQRLFKNILGYNIFNLNSQQSQNQIQSVEGNKPPQVEDSIQGKYAGVLFQSASSQSVLHLVADDMKYFQELNQESEVFRQFLSNVSLKRTEQRQILEALGKDSFSEVTNNLLETLVENKRLDQLPKVAEKYIEYYRILNKQESITIISAKELNQEEKDKVEDGLKRGNQGVQFTVTYQVDSSILGGLQMYSGKNFLDCSLLSRINKLKSEIIKISF
ncbi:ATP synthase delta subunit precursor, putative [Ichthyophthirius multifiliis]|uniref:ATP synthase delta subunit, putative n=1 Tax=Ichthyophthirius multifiliis TaxID=5932 RepID=G0R2R0_ICHMU|nr:ATP synthase delta subunit precursor, putative [Ichthyophthirius multifiliis]EGR28242.1 ATP synthase delta subunit precursor, putative [Ichthyophthirius multifiliis]|eukprot:XP_004027587.1 ATP synthase delta subunit precursor, putative [Ichthyophthirius multifiliis]